MKVTRAAFRHGRNYGLALASEVLAPVLRGLSCARTGTRSTPPAAWRHGLIVGHSHIGDVLYRTCSLAQLAAHLPACRWDYLTSPASASVLSSNPALRSVLPLAHDDDSPAMSIGSFRHLRRTGYDVVLCTNTVRHAQDFALALALGIPNRVGFGNKGYSGMLTLPVPLEYPQPLAAYFRTMVGAVTGVAPDWPLRPAVFPAAHDRRRADECVRQLDLDTSLPILACVATSRQARGTWPPDFFAAVIECALRARPLNVVLFGATGDAPVLHGIASSLSAPARVVAGELGWLEFAEVLQRCSALLTADSGPRHIANAVGTPVLFARNLSFSRVEAGTYCIGEHDIAPASAELLHSRDVAAVVRGVAPRDVAERLLEMLRSPGLPTVAAR